MVDLALKAYLEENPSATGIDTNSRDFTMAQIKLFIFAGHDTTSTGAVFTYHLLTQHAKILAKLRAEQDRVFGADTTAAASSLSSNPSLLNQLPYTLVVIKESLRIYPAVAAARGGQPDFCLSNDNGMSFPKKDCLVWGDHSGTHHNPRHWPQPEASLPERFLLPEGRELYPPKKRMATFRTGSSKLRRPRAGADRDQSHVGAHNPSI